MTSKDRKALGDDDLSVLKPKRTETQPRLTTMLACEHLDEPTSTAINKCRARV